MLKLVAFGLTKNIGTKATGVRSCKWPRPRPETLGASTPGWRRSSFQARPFYERFGYQCFGVLNDHPLGHTHYFMYKRLA